MKKIAFLLIIFSHILFLCAQNPDNEKLIKFIKGNISEKTSAVREASGAESILLALKAIDFSLENKDLLGNDRELEGLAVAAILSISPDYIKNANDSQKSIIVSQFINLFNKFFESNTVAIATLTKYSSLYEYMQDRQFVETLNFFLKSQEIKKTDESVMKSVFNTLQMIGNSETFLPLYDNFDNKNYAHLKNEIENTLVSLSFISQNEIIGLLETADIKDLSQIFKIIKKNSKISKNYVCDVSEKVISKSILLLGSSSFVSQEDILVQLEALNNLSDNKWTRASLVAVSYFQFAKKIYNQNLMTDTQFESVINCLSNVSPVDAVNPLTAYLEELNRQKENETDVSSAIVLSVIKTLGAIGDKSAFDSLLAVTYLDYDESISGLRW